MRIPSQERVGVTLFAGPRGAGKTTTMLALLGVKPAGEPWTLVIEELGKTMPDPGLLSANNVAVRGAPYGCPCCSGNVTLRVALGRAVRETRPKRLMLELPWGAHVGKLVALFDDPLLAGSLFIEGVIAVVDSDSLSTEVLAPPMVEILCLADAIVVAARGVPPARAKALLSSWGSKPLVFGVDSAEIGVLLNLRALPGGAS